MQPAATGSVSPTASANPAAAAFMWPASGVLGRAMKATTAGVADFDVPLGDCCAYIMVSIFS